jgi:cytochrome c peroxidase
VPRNAPSTYNVALWSRSLFWDGRVESLNPTAGENGSVGGISTPDSGFGKIDNNAGANLSVAQARFPVTSPEEMRGFIFEAKKDTATARTHLASRLNDPSQNDYITNTWQNEFTAIYGANSVTFKNIVDAIGEYERSQLFVNTAWKAYVEGETSAISTSAKRGALLFYESYANGGADCVSCHTGDFFTDEEYHVMAVPQVGRGKGNGSSKDDDFGRFNVDNNSSHRYAFRTPTLLNIETTGPWGHDGAYTSLKAMVKHMLNPADAIKDYNTSQLNHDVKTTNMNNNTNHALNQLNSNRQAGISTHQNVSFTEAQIDNLLAFLTTLTDSCITTKSCIEKWIPKNEVGVDSLQLNAIDKNGDLL